jgi:peptide/nickel transport system permease protein
MGVVVLPISGDRGCAVTVPIAQEGSATIAPAKVGRSSWLRSGSPSILRYLVGRVIATIATVLAASFAIYASSSLIPGDPVGALTRGRITDPAKIAELKAQYRLDQPVFSGFVDWLRYAAQGDFGMSITYRQPVAELVASRVPVTLALVLYTLLIIAVLGPALGALGALRPGWMSSSVTVLTTMWVAVPAFVCAAVLILVLSVQFPVFPAFGAGQGFLDRIYHLTLPATALALSSIALLARVTQVAMEEELKSEHVQTAWSRGLRWRQVIGRHVVRNSLIPMTTVAGVSAAYLITGTVVVEAAFGLSGIGTLLTQAVIGRDFAVVQAVVLLMIISFILINTMVDVLYTLIDPRIRLGAADS